MPSEQRIPCYQVLNEEGELVEGADMPDISNDTMIEIHTKMVTLNIMDGILYDAQRQGRISFYMTSTGEEAASVASGAALHPHDPVFSQYREQGVLMWRGFSLLQFANQCFSNARDMGKGRQMPIHYGSPELFFLPVSSPLTTQLPHAVGTAYALKRENAQLFGTPKVAVSYFGDGAASEGDCHAAFNFASTLKTPCLFLCRNNGYAISTPVPDQFAGDGIASRCPGYGMRAFRVDGNDALAVYHAVRTARKHAVENNEPVLVEMMTYRVGHHSTSDDSTRYRSVDTIKDMRETVCPISRLNKYLTKQGLWDSEQDEALRKSARSEVIQAMKYADGEDKTPLEEMFEDVYDKSPQHLRRQRKQLSDHLKIYGEQYSAVLKSRRIKMDISLKPPE